MLYLLVHTWKKEDFKVVGRKMIEALPGVPKDSTMLFSYADARQTGAWCVWDTEHPEEVVKYFAKTVPEMHLVDTIPLVQFFPPGPELYKLIHVLSSM